MRPLPWHGNVLIKGQAVLYGQVRRVDCVMVNCYVEAPTQALFRLDREILRANNALLTTALLNH